MNYAVAAVSVAAAFYGVVHLGASVSRGLTWRERAVYAFVGADLVAVGAILFFKVAA
jgi:hypothetical protein